MRFECRRRIEKRRVEQSSRRESQTSQPNDAFVSLSSKGSPKPKPLNASALSLTRIPWTRIPDHGLDLILRIQIWPSIAPIVRYIRFNEKLYSLLLYRILRFHLISIKFYFIEILFANSFLLNANSLPTNLLIVSVI